MRPLTLLALLLLAACPEQKAELVGVDRDEDGYHSGIDCDDADPDVNPGATEIPYNGIDDDCDPLTPDDDLDGDGFGFEEDCDDEDPRAYPGADEVCDGIDNNCDGAVDGGLALTWFRDADGDGFGDPETSREACAAESGWVRNDLDCDDEDDAIHPLAVEICDGIDNDCDGGEDNDVTALLTWYRDADGDGFGDAEDVLHACDAPEGYVANPDDCDDDPTTGPNVHPGADETCNDNDDDCDGDADNDPVDGTTFYLDADGDTFGTPDVTLRACANPNPTLWVENDDDCWDFDALAKPGGVEVCNGLDDDCDGHVDVGATDAPTWYRDADGDGFGDPEVTTARCDDGGGAWVDNDLDCDDDADDGHLSFPGGVETCDGRDNDCNGVPDDAPDAPLWFLDADEDGFGDPDVARRACADPSDETESWQANNDDCDDDDDAVHPGAVEVCNDVDDDCDGLVDDGASPLHTWYFDGDGDGVGVEEGSVTGCSAPTPHHVDTAGDCDDTDPETFPGAPEQCNLVDNDCDEAFPGPTECVWGATCKDVLEAFPSLARTDRVYRLNPAGEAQGDEEGALYFCDMTAGDDDRPGAGWMLLVDDDFEDDSANGWRFSAVNGSSERTPAVTTCGDPPPVGFGKILGGYDETDDGIFKRRLADVPHDELWIELDILQIDSWDGELVWVSLFENVAPTYEYLLWFDNWSFGTVGVSNVCGASGQPTWFESSHRIVEHVGSSVDPFELWVGNLLDQAANNESIGIDNVEVWVR